MEDREFDLCMERMKNGDKSALKDVYEAYKGYIFHLIKSVLQNHENAEDVTSDFFIKLWSIADHYTPGGGHRAYLGRIAHNMAIDYLRAHKREIPFDASEAGFENALAGNGFTNSYGDETDESKAESSGSPSGKSLGGTIQNDDRNADATANEVISDLSVEEMLSKLKPAEREVVHLKIIGELTFEEISKLTEQPMGTVTWRYREAIKKLRRCGFDA